MATDIIFHLLNPDSPSSQMADELKDASARWGEPSAETLKMVVWLAMLAEKGHYTRLIDHARQQFTSPDQVSARMLMRERTDKQEIAELKKLNRELHKQNTQLAAEILSQDTQLKEYEQNVEILKFGVKKHTEKTIAEKYGVSQQSVSDRWPKRSYSHRALSGWSAKLRKPATPRLCSLAPKTERNA